MVEGVSQSRHAVTEGSKNLRPLSSRVLEGPANASSAYVFVILFNKPLANLSALTGLFKQNGPSS